MTRTDELGHRLVIVVALAKEDTFLAIADGREAIITDKDAMQPVDFCLVERAFSRFEYGTRPSLQTIDRRALSLNLEARDRASQCWSEKDLPEPESFLRGIADRPC